jgi:hypothetical protein
MNSEFVPAWLGTLLAAILLLNCIVMLGVIRRVRRLEREAFGWWKR